MKRREVLGLAGAAGALFIADRVGVFSAIAKGFKESTVPGEKVLVIYGILIISADIPLRTKPNSEAPILSANHPELQYRRSIIIPPPADFQGKLEDGSWLQVVYPDGNQYGFIPLKAAQFPQGKNSPVEGRLTPAGTLFSVDGSVLDNRPNIIK